MEEKKALEILLKTVNRLNGEEKEAVLCAIGLLDTAVIAKEILRRRTRARKVRRENYE